jgi:hypothetical protein
MSNDKGGDVVDGQGNGGGVVVLVTWGGTRSLALGQRAVGHTWVVALGGGGCTTVPASCQIKVPTSPKGPLSPLHFNQPHALLRYSERVTSSTVTQRLRE